MAFTPGTLWPDNNGVHINAHGGAMLFHDGYYWWFGEHKVAGDAGNKAEVGVHVYRSTDLYSWEDQGIALFVSDDMSHGIARGCILERPKVLFNKLTNRFVMWFHLEPKGKGYLGARVGVAVAERVAGPYRFVKSFRPDAGIWPLNVDDNEKSPLAPEEFAGTKYTGAAFDGYDAKRLFRRDFTDGQMSRDMTLFADDDDTAYHIYASEENGVLHISQLTPDYLGSSGRWARAFPGRFMEAPAMFRHNGKYWIIASGCTGWKPNAARSAVADSPFGPWKDLGNPWIGADVDTAISFDSQPAFIFPVQGRPGAFIFLGDRWRPENAIDGRYIWQPIEFENDRPVLRWHDSWDLRFFDRP
ncbi:MAG: glycoside hydrolase family 43 protein [Spirochaetota bacterium]